MPRSLPAFFKKVVDKYYPFAASVANPGGGKWWDEIAGPIYTPRMVAVVDARGLPNLRKLNSMRPEDHPDLNAG